MSDRAVKLRIEGKVQNVWYRAWTAEQAARSGLRGWVRNCGDGSVEALFVGPGEAVAAMVEACHRGPPAARVTRVVETAAADDGTDGFHQRPTE